MARLGEIAARGIGAIAHGVFKGCPQVKEINLTGWDGNDPREVVNGMLEAAGLVGKVKVVYCLG
jgi:hypothetical protein